MPCFLLLLLCLGVWLESLISPGFFLLFPNFLSCFLSVLSVALFQLPIFRVLQPISTPILFWVVVKAPGDCTSLAHQVSVAWHSSTTESGQGSTLLCKCHWALVKHIYASCVLIRLRSPMDTGCSVGPCVGCLSHLGLQSFSQLFQKGPNFHLSIMECH